MQNTFANEYAPQESIHQVKSYFDIIDNAVSIGDTNKKYTPSKNPSSPGGTQAENTYLTFNISPVGENICDLYNSTITAQMTVVLRASDTVTAFPSDKLPDCNAPAVWIGFTDAFDSVAAYQILANGRQIYTQDNAHNESFITSCGATEAVKKVDIFSKARHKDVWKRADTIKSGFIIDGSVINSSKDITCVIPIKIDVRRFLVLDSIRYLPAFAGNIQVKVKFSSEALQIAPLSVEDILQTPINFAKVAYPYPKITNKFVPFEEPITMIKTVAVTGDSASAVTKITLTAANIQFTKKNATISETFSHLNCFSLDPNVYTELVEHYSQVALSFPIKRIDWLSMDGSLNSSGKSTFTAQFTPLFVNSIFVLFKKKANYHCNYDNPLFKTVQINMGAYGNVPADPEASNGPVFYEMCANAMNTNNDLCGFNVDVMRSLTTNKIEDTGYVSNDTTHFFIGFPTETDFTAFQGQTSNSPINYKLTVEASETSKAFQEKPELGFLRHCTFSIQIRPNGPPVVTIDDYDLSAPAPE